MPTGYLIGDGGKVLETFEAWDSRRFEELANYIAARLHISPHAIIAAKEEVVPFKPG